MDELDLRDLPPPPSPEHPLYLSLYWGLERMTPWERIAANDETWNFAETVREAMSLRNDQTLLLGKLR